LVLPDAILNSMP